MMFKELSEEFVKFMIWLFTILAVNATDTEDALLVKHNSFLMAAVVVSFVNLLVFVLATVLQLNTKTRRIAEFVLGSSISILASFVISFAIGWLTLILWLCVFAVLAVVNIKNTVKPTSSIVG